jgi:hypothetical protein
LAAAAVFILWEPMQPYRAAVAAFIPAINPASPMRHMWQYVLTWSAGAFIGIIILIVLFYALYLSVKQFMKWLK